MLLSAIILAQAVESLSGGAGWVGAGLLGAVRSAKKTPNAAKNSRPSSQAL